ncbi:MAG: MG2 domain-containing protein, partial [Aurantibacter sp.]
MKNLLLILTIILFSQMASAQQNNKSYDELWKQVEKLENGALPKSALKVVETIFEKAKKEKSSPQIVKALLHSSKYAMTLEEDAQLKIVNDFKAEIEKAEFPTKNVLESYLANMYWQFFQNNRYRFYNRTKTEAKVDSADFRSWDLTTLFHEIDSHFKKSLENENELQGVLVTEFGAILVKQDNSAEYRPSLFDLLAHTALQFYKTTENNITRPADKFEIDDPEMLCEVDQYTQLKIDSSDKTSMQARALQIYQKLLRLHLPSSKPYTLAEVDIERLLFTYRNATFENKDERYLEVLQNMTAATKGSPTASLYQYEIATLYLQWGQTYQPKGNEEHLWKLKEALELCESVITEYPNSRGAEKCKALKSQILSQSLQMTNEEHIPIDMPSRLLVNYKNHDQLQLSARKISINQLEQLNNIWEHPKKLAFLKKLGVVKEWEATLKDEKDYQEHRTEILLPALPNGQYVILAMPKENKNGTFAYSPVQVTDFALVETRTPTHHNFQVIDRNNGKPITGANVKFTYQIRYDGPRRSKTLVTDKMGTVSIPLTKENWNNVSVLVTQNGEKAFYKDYYVNQRYEPAAQRVDYTAFLFTDRSIYRPGQPLYFKGIAIKREMEVSTILENTVVNVVLKDVNYQEVASQELKTNEYGSFSGDFILPSSGLTGNFSLEVNAKKIGLNGSTSFSVEEYKRPKFETFFEPITETYKVNDSIRVDGVATAYAGSHISDAKVAYTVRRVVYFPRWYYWYRPYYDTTPQEIARGETKTDASGKYKIQFKAIPDTKASKKDLPTFSYEVTADVTDINGETHSTTTTVRVGYHSLTASIDAVDPLDKDQDDTRLSISTNNLNGQFVPAKGTLKMYKLTPPEYVLRRRPWAAPDYEGFTKNEFKKLYPHDAYGNEHDHTNWEKGKLVGESDFDTGEAKEIELGNHKKWLSGKYVIELETKDKFGQEVKDITYT